MDSMIRKLMAAIAAMLFVAGILAGCAGGIGGGQYKVAMVTDVGGLGDESFNDSAHRGLKDLESKDKMRISVVESKKQEDYEPNLGLLADQKFDVVWAIGFLMTDATNKVAGQKSNVKFGIIDSVVEKPNVASVVFKEEEGSFLMGILAAKATKTNKVGFIGGMDVPIIHKFEAGFRAGVKAVNPNVQVIVVYTGNFHDVASGKEAAITIYGQGADIIFSAAGACGIGAIEAAKEKNLMAIGVDSDQNKLAPNHVISSMMKRVDVAIYEVSKLAKAGNFPGGKVTVLGLKENGVGWSDTTLWAKMPGDTKALAEKWRKAIIDGKANVPSDRQQFNAWQVPQI
jgi:basic membrane protein A and related proteins